jgi:hypothetical protein
MTHWNAANGIEDKPALEIPVGNLFGVNDLHTVSIYVRGSKIQHDISQEVYIDYRIPEPNE